MTDECKSEINMLLQDVKQFNDRPGRAILVWDQGYSQILSRHIITEQDAHVVYKNLKQFPIVSDYFQCKYL